MRLSRNERILAELGIVILVALIAALLGFLSYEGVPLSTRLALSILGFVAAWIAVRVLAIIGAATAKLLGLRPVWGYAFAIPLSSALIAWAVLWSVSGSSAALGEEFSAIWPRSTLIGVGFFVLFFVIYWRAYAASPSVDETDEKEPGAAPAPSRMGVAKSALHERLPQGFPPILALCVEDHYVRVIADERTEMLLISLGEAIALMPQDAGEQVHRSWWVAKSAVATHKRTGRDISLELSSGIAVPVSRAKVQPLREAGWL